MKESENHQLLTFSCLFFFYSQGSVLVYAPTLIKTWSRITVTSGLNMPICKMVRKTQQIS